LRDHTIIRFKFEKGVLFLKNKIVSNFDSVEQKTYSNNKGKEKVLTYEE